MASKKAEALAEKIARDADQLLALIADEDDEVYNAENAIGAPLTETLRGRLEELGKILKKIDLRIEAAKSAVDTFEELSSSISNAIDSIKSAVTNS